MRAIIVASLVALLAALAPAAAQNAPQQPAPARQAQQGPAPPRPAGPISVELKAPAGPDWANPKCGEPRSHDEADLCQQQRLADAAERAVWLNTIQIAIGALLMLGLAGVIYYARQTAIAGITAAKAAAANALASRDAVDASQAQIRAQLIRTEARFEHLAEERMFAFSYKTRNIGKSHARRIRASATVETVTHGGSRSAAFVLDHDERDIVADTERRMLFVNRGFALAADEERALKSNALQVRVHFKYSFIDVFNQEFEESLVLIGPVRLDKGGHVIADLRPEDQDQP